jgi:Domain of unknown function (DUF397)
MMGHELGGIVWRKSSYTGDNGNCVEVGWHKSSHSASNGNCVEVGWPEPVGVAVRDSKHPTGPTLTFATPNWRTFLTNPTPHVSPAQTP